MVQLVIVSIGKTCVQLFVRNVMPFETAEKVMWQLVQQFTGQVGYKRGVKSEGLTMTPPVIDCSGWTGLLLMRAMQAENDVAGRTIFSADDVCALQTWSDRIIHEIATRTGFILEGREITVHSLPRCATIGLKMGEPDWAKNHPRSRAITHVVQIVRCPKDNAPFVSEAFGSSVSPGIGLVPLDQWLAHAQPSLDATEVWAVDPFRLGSGK
jgi:hypothetical protein